MKKFPLSLYNRETANFDSTRFFEKLQVKLAHLGKKSLDFECLKKCFMELLKSASHPPKKIIFIYFNKSPLKMMRNAFYFTLKALFVLKTFTFSS